MKYGTTAGLLKPLDEMTLPDPRIEHEPYRPRGDASLGAADIRERLEKNATLHKGVPQDIATQFEVARNLMLYSYFVFEFQTQAEFQAYAALEFALRERFDRPTIQKKRGNEILNIPVMLKGLLQRAVDENLLQPEKFPSFAWTNQLRKFHAERMGHKVEPISAKEWLELIQKHIKGQRDHLAHGNPHLWLPSSFDQIERCADIINALFPTCEVETKLEKAQP
jgi:hypothetical protein